SDQVPFRRSWAPSLPLGGRLASSMPGPVVEAAGEAAVVLRGGPALAPGDHVVDLAALGICLTARMEAAPVAHLDGPAQGPLEQPSPLAHLDDPGRGVEDH